MAARRVEFDQNVQTLGPSSGSGGGHSSSDQSWSSVASTSATSRTSLLASTSSERYQQRQSPVEISRNAPEQSHYSPNYSYRQSYHNGPSPNRIEYYEEDDDDYDDDSYSLYINESAGYVSRYPPPSKLANVNRGEYHGYDYEDQGKRSATHHLHPTTLYRSGSISIVNCEYKLKEKYPHLIYLIFFVIIYILLILLGASLFVLFEAKTELRLRDQILLQQQMFLDENSCVDSKDLKSFVKAIMAANDKGVNLAKLNELIDLLEAKQNETLNASNSNSSALPEFAQEALDTVEKALRKQVDSSKGKYYASEEAERREELAGPSRKSDKASDAIQITQHVKPIKVPVEMANWEFLSSLTYVTTVVTTIGYGHVTPATSEGKILTLVYGAIAIPATLLFFSIIISTIRDGPVKAIEIWMIKLLSRFTHITLLRIRFLHLLLVTFILFLMLILLPSFVFLRLEPDWTFLDSFYYCFITITTVGLGDYVPAQSVLTEGRPFYLIGTVLYMYFGLCMIMLWIALVLRIPYFNFKTFLVIEEPEIAEEKISDERTRLLDDNSNSYMPIY